MLFDFKSSWSAPQVSRPAFPSIVRPLPNQIPSNNINLPPLPPLLPHKPQHPHPTHPPHNPLPQPHLPLNLRRALPLQIPHRENLPHLKNVQKLPPCRSRPAPRPLLNLRFSLQARARVQDRDGGVLARVWGWRASCGRGRLAEGGGGGEGGVWLDGA